MRNASVLWTYVQLMSGKDRAVAFAVAVSVLVFLMVSVLWGSHIGAHVGAEGWVCDQMPKGAPYCVREPELPRESDARALKAAESRR
jgi:hypothetical protein